MDKNVLPKAQLKPKPKPSQWRRVAAVAAITLFLGTSVYLYNKKDKTPYLTLDQITAPDKSNAIIVLENNSTYNLDSLRIGDTLRMAEYSVIRTIEGEIKYLTDNPSKIVYNTIRTTTGGTAHVQLSDGSRVWINVNSELRFPIQFTNDHREVALKGEGYFEVAKAVVNNKRTPFYVRGENQTIQVLGTKFNADFSPKNQVALLEGSIVLAERGSQLQTIEPIRFPVQVKPNQVYANGTVTESDDIDSYIAWKEGYFNLNRKSVAEIAEELSSWYGVELQVDEKLASVKLFGSFHKEKSLQEVLDLIAQICPMEYKYQNNRVSLKYK